MSRRSLTAAAAATAIVAAALVALTLSGGDAGRERAAVTPVPAEPGGGGAAAAPPADAGGRVGLEREYRLSFSTAAQVSATTLLLDLRIAGRLALTDVASGPSRIVRGVFVADAVTLGDGSDASAQRSAAALRAALERPFFLVHRADGVLSDVRGDLETLPLVAQLWRSVGATMQVAAAPAGAAEWRATEADATGTYEASYRNAQSRSATRLIEKRKERYLTASQGAALPEIVESLITIEADERGVLQVDSGERLRVRQPPLPAVESRTTLQLVRESSRDRGAAVAGWLAAFGSARALPTALDSTPTPESDRARVADWKYAEMLAALRDTGTPEGKRRANRAYSAMCALLRLEPERIDDVRRRVLAGGSLRRTMIAALRDAGTPEAQAALRDLVQAAALGGEDRLAVARALSLVDAPVKETVDALRALRGDPLLGAQATYGLGASVAHLRDRDPELAKGVLAELLAQHASAGSQAQRIDTLTALGNAGDVGALEAIAEELRSPSDDVRAAAANALRRVDASGVDRLLAQASMDPATPVRRSAVAAMTNRTPTPALADALARTLESEPVFEVRALAVQIAARWTRAGFDPVTPPLRLVALRDANADLRRIAQAALDASAAR